MNLLVEKESLLPLLGQIQGIVEKRANIPILSNVLIEAKGKKIFLYASDSETSFSARVSGDVEEGGKALVSGKKLFEIVRELPSGELSLRCEGKSVRIEKGQSKSLIHGLSPEDFPPFPPVEGAWREISAERFLDMADKTIYCASLDESRHHLTGVFCERVSSGVCRFVATDSHRMSFVDVPLKDSGGLKEGIIIPRKGILEIKKMLAAGAPEEGGESLLLSVEKPRLAARFKGQTLSVRLIEAKYPDYRLLIPGERTEDGKKAEKRKRAVFSREKLVSALKRVSVMTSARFRGINFEFEKTSLKISTSPSDLGEASEKISCRYDGGKLKIRFNSRYALEALQSFSGEKAEMFLKDKDSESSLLIQEESEESCKAVIMPMKL